MLVSWAHKHAEPVSMYVCTFLYCYVFTAFIVCVNMQVYEYMAAVLVCACAQCVLVGVMRLGLIRHYWSPLPLGLEVISLESG